MQEGYTYAALTFQVPFAQFENVMNSLRALPGKGGRVDSEQTSGQDVTEEYTDTESQIRNLQIEENDLLALLKGATKLDDILTLQTRLADIRGQIERFQGRIKFLTNRTDYSTITLTINPIIPPAPTPTPAPEPTPTPKPTFDGGKVAGHAFDKSLDFLSGVATFAIRVAFFGWWLVPFLLGAGLFYRRYRRQEAIRRRQQQAAEPATGSTNGWGE